MESSSGSPVFSFFTPCDQQISEFAVDGLLHQDALHGNAGLPGVAESARDATFGGVLEIGVAVDDDAGVAAQFEDDFFLAGAAS